MGYAIAAKRLDRRLHKTIYVKKSKTYRTKWDAEVFLKDWRKKHPQEDFVIIEV